MKKNICILTFYFVFIVPAFTQSPLPFIINDQTPTRFWADTTFSTALCDLGEVLPFPARRLKAGDMLVIEMSSYNKSATNNVGQARNQPSGERIEILLRAVPAGDNFMNLTGYERKFLNYIIVTNNTLPNVMDLAKDEEAVWNYIMTHLIVYRNKYGRVLVKLDCIKLGAEPNSDIRSLFKETCDFGWAELIVPVFTESSISSSRDNTRDNLDGLGCSNKKYYPEELKGESRPVNYNAYSIILSNDSYAEKTAKKAEWTAHDWAYSDVEGKKLDDINGIKIKIKKEHPFLFCRSRKYKVELSGGENLPIEISDNRYIKKIKKTTNNKRKAKCLTPETLREIQMSQLRKNGIKFYTR